MVETVTDDDVEAAAVAVRAYAGSRTANAHDADDIAQEAISRLLKHRHRLDRPAAVPYAMTIAKGLLADSGRRRGVERRNLHRLHLADHPVSPEDAAIRQADIAAVGEALRSMSDDERDTLVEHVIDGRSLGEVGGEELSAGGIAAGLARTRARARLDYLLAVRGVELPTDRCRRVLLALSSGDQRRQRAATAAHHLLECDTCASLAPPLVQRQRSLAGVLPVPAVAAFVGARWGWVLRAPRTAAVVAATTGTAAVVMVGVAVWPEARPARTATSTSIAVATTTAPRATTTAPRATTLRIAGADGWALAPDLRARDQRPVIARRATVASVPADEGFWISDGRRRVWVQMLVPEESPVEIRRGDRISFDGIVVAHGPDYPRTAGLTRQEGADALAAAGAHVEVEAAAVRVDR